MRLDQLLEDKKYDFYVRQLLMKLAGVADHPFKKTSFGWWVSAAPTKDDQELIDITVTPTIWGSVVEVRTDANVENVAYTQAKHTQVLRALDELVKQGWTFTIGRGDTTMKTHSNETWPSTKYTVKFPRFVYG